MARNSGGGFGTWFYGFLVGGVIGVGCCAAAALYITKAPIPFVNKVNQASEKINPIAGGTIPDPNKPLSASGGAPENAPKSRVVTVEPPTSEQAAEETKLQIEQGSRFVVQAGAFSTQVDAEARRAELGFLGFEARVIPRTDGPKHFIAFVSDRTARPKKPTMSSPSFRLTPSRRLSDASNNFLFTRPKGESPSGSFVLVGQNLCFEEFYCPLVFYFRSSDTLLPKIRSQDRTTPF